MQRALPPMYLLMCCTAATVWDPFTEWAGTSGFRGFEAGADAVCGRSCSWYR